MKHEKKKKKRKRLMNEGSVPAVAEKVAVRYFCKECGSEVFAIFNWIYECRKCVAILYNSQVETK